MKDSKTGKEAIKDAALILCNAIRAHALLCGQELNDTQSVATASARIDQAAANYERVVRDMSGWGVSFERYREGAYPKYDQLLDEHAVAGGGVAAAETVWPIVTDRYEIEVASAARLVEFTRARWETDIAGPAEAIQLMYEKDGWRPDSYPGDLLSIDDYSVSVLSNSEKRARRA
jgi:hypothetical protein